MIGQTVSHYRVLEKIGSGGMGIVYKAEDMKLGRFVALKFLPVGIGDDPLALERFKREARMASSLNHPNICTIYDIDEHHGQPFIAMELLEGRSLREHLAGKPLTAREVVELALEITDALDKAHSKGVVHRDIKPENIFITDTRHGKILDFGLACEMSVSNLEANLSASPTLGLTSSGTTVGTVRYMSPEQVRCEKIDARSDLYSFGVVVYEMAAGRHPIDSSVLGVIFDAILNKRPDPPSILNPDVPRALETIVLKALEKDPGMRYRNAHDLRLDLLRLKQELDSGQMASRAGSRRPSIAVRPFVNMSADADNEYFSDGLAEELIAALSKLDGVQVASRTSAFQFKGKSQDIRSIGERLNVATVLEGSVRKFGSRLRITAQLINVSDGYHLWSEKYDRDMEDVFAIQDEIAEIIVRTLKVKLGGPSDAPIVARYTKDVEAYHLYLRGRYYWNKRTDELLHESMKYFQQAIDRDPEYALAYAAMADCYAVLGMAEYGILPPHEAMPKAKAAALAALRIDGNLAEAHTSLAHVTAFYDWDWPLAARTFQRATELNPNYAMAHHWYAIFLIAMGRADEALAEERRAQELEPLSLIINKNVGTIFHYARRLDDAINQYQRTLQLDAGFVRTHLYLGLSYLIADMFDDAVAELEKSVSLAGPRGTVFRALLANAHGRAGRKAEAMQILEELKQRCHSQYVPALNLAVASLGLGNSDETFFWLEKAYEERSSWLVSLRVEPLFDGLRSDPRFEKLAQRVGLPERAS